MRQDHPSSRWRRHWPILLCAPLVIACRAPNDLLEAVGTLEMVEVDVGPLQAARAVVVAVHEGDAVRVGDTLAVFALPTLAAREAQAAAGLDAAREASRDVSRGSRPAEIAQAESQLRAAEAQAERTVADAARFRPLAQRGDISRAQMDAAESAARIAASQRDAAREVLRLVTQGPTAERRAVAAAQMRSAAAAANAVRATANDLVLLATVNGVVTSRNVEPGEVVGAGQSAVTIGQPQRPWARIYVSQFVVPTLHVGDTLRAHLDDDSTAYVGRIVAIASRAEYTPRVALTEQERADLLFGIKIEFSNASDRLRAGLPITVRLPRPAN